VLLISPITAAARQRTEKEKSAAAGVRLVKTGNFSRERRNKHRNFGAAWEQNYRSEKSVPDLLYAAEKQRWPVVDALL
jgi:hypothetical protein